MSPHKLSILKKKKIVTIEWRNLADTILTKGSKLKSLLWLSVVWQNPPKSDDLKQFIIIFHGSLDLVGSAGITHRLQSDVWNLFHLKGQYQFG